MGLKGSLGRDTRKGHRRGGHKVAVDVSPDSTRFATGTRSIGIKFSPNDEHTIVTAIHVFETRTGDNCTT